MAKAKKRARPGRREKFNLGKKALTRALQAAQSEAEDAVVVGKKSVKDAQNAGDPQALKFNRENLRAARSAVRYFRGAIREIGRMECPDQWMNCDPEFIFARRGAS
jgi:hypothetical protein